MSDNDVDGVVDVEREQRRVVHPELDVDLGELLPGDELARCAVDGLLRELEGPLDLALGTEEVALGVEEGVGLGVVP